MIYDEDLLAKIRTAINNAYNNGYDLLDMYDDPFDIAYDLSEYDSDLSEYNIFEIIKHVASIVKE